MKKKTIEKIEDITSPLETVHASERAYFDQKAKLELKDFEREEVLIDPVAHYATMRMWGLENDLNGKKVLECGCGSGFFSVLLAKMGAEVWCFDLSQRSIELTIKRAALNGVHDRVRAKVAAFGDLDYEEESFDLIVGKNILHHIPDLKEAGRQIRRMLKKGGRATFYELSANNPMLLFFRRYVIGKTRFIPKLGTPDEHPLTKTEVETLSAVFNNQCKISYPKFRFFGKFDRQVFKQRYRPISFILEGMDRMIYTFFPPLRKYSYKILLEFTK